MRRQSTKNGTHHPDFGMMYQGAMDDVAVFVAVARAGSFVGASTQTRMPTSTVSRAIARLEERLGLALFRRSSRKVALTDAGRNLLLRASPSVDALREAIAETTDERGDIAGSIRITAPTFTGATRVTARLAAFARKHPRVTIELDASNSLRDLVMEGYDVGIRVGPSVDADFVARKLWTGRFGLYATEALLKEVAGARAARARTIDRAVVERGPCVVTRSSAVWRFRDQRDDVVQVKPKGRFIVNDPRAALLAASAGIGFVLAPQEAGATMKELVALTCEKMAPEPTDLYLVYPTRRLQPLRVRKLIEWLASTEA
jgi:DNA-binding transcriptional LysR family regulator